MNVLEQPDYPPGDLRSEIWFRLAIGGFRLAIAAFVLVSSLRRLRERDWRPPFAPEANE